MNDKIKDKDQEKKDKIEEISRLNKELGEVNSLLAEKYQSLDKKRREKDELMQEINKCENEFTTNNMYAETIDNEINNYVDGLAKKAAKGETNYEV